VFHVFVSDVRERQDVYVDDDARLRVSQLHFKHRLPVRLVLRFGLLPAVLRVPRRNPNPGVRGKSSMRVPLEYGLSGRRRVHRGGMRAVHVE
jgi:hypothetical protein